MTVAALITGTRMTDEEYLALGETELRTELFDGSLHVSPPPSFRHQRVSFRIAAAFVEGAEEIGLNVFEGVGIRLRTGRYVVPDVVVTAEDDASIGVPEAVSLVCEIISPHNASTDKLRKMHYYAAAGIPWYLLVELDGTLRMFCLDGDTYREDSVTPPDKALTMIEPFKATILSLHRTPGGKMS